MTYILHFLNWDGLTDWEEKFVISVDGYFQRRGDLTEAQEETLENIFREKGT